MYCGRFVAFLLSFFSVAILHAAPNATLQFVQRGRDSNPVDLVQGGSWTGHIFMIVSTPTNHGMKEDAYGFYPREGGLGQIKGPGMLKSEFRCLPTDDCSPKEYTRSLKEFSKVERTVAIPISDDDKKIIFRDIAKWDDPRSKFVLTDNNCIDFIGTIAHDLGYPTPNRYSSQTPAAYMAELSIVIAGEQQKRQLESQVLSAKADAARSRQEAAKAQAERDQAQAERDQAQAKLTQVQIDAANRAEQARQAQASKDAAAAAAATIPASWVACTCPAQHYLSGKWKGNVLYHPVGISCR